jgi:ribose 5-phosphate isomerase B
MRIAVASDHAGYLLKEFVKNKLEKLGHEIEDYGAHDEQSTDYPDHGRPAAEAVAHGKADLAVLFCGTGIGMSMTANKVKFVRAAVCSEPLSARMTRKHNDANCLCMGARLIGQDMAEQILYDFLNTEFEGGRHQRRIDKLEG